MGTPNSLNTPGSEHNVETTAKEPQQALSDTVKPTRRRRLVELVANRFRSSPSEKGGQLAKKVVVEGGVAGPQVVPRQPAQDEAMTPIDKGVEGNDAQDGAQVVAQQPPQVPSIDKVLDVPEDFLSDLRGVLAKGQVSRDTPFELTKELEGKLALYSEAKVKEYDVLRQQGTHHEASLGFDFACTRKASPIEIKANEVLQHLKKNDIARFYETADERIGYRGQEHERFYGDHFLSNADLIEQTQLFALFRAMPKGAHLHIHFNANLLPSVLLSIAKDQDHMFIWSDRSLVHDVAFDRCRIQFSIMSEAAVKERGTGNLFDANYRPGDVMQFKQFLKAHPQGEEAALEWLQSKLVFQEEEAHNLLQTPDGAWEEFNARTQMMKGLFNYETAYRKYTAQCLQEFVDDNIQYAEIRPNFMSSNQVWKDDGSGRIDNVGIMNMIIEEYEKFQTGHTDKHEQHQNRHHAGDDGKRKKGHQREILKGLKIIYCTPRSFSEEQVGEALMQCFQFKMDERFSEYIAGFDLVGQESKGKPLKDFRAQLLRFKALCKAANVEIPFLFHCGETLDIGTDTDGNLMDALLLGAKRIGHGFALPRHPYVIAQMKQRNVCVEVCPISNEILGLTPRMSGHSVYNLLANNVPCTINTDNGTLFRSRLSHDFYQIMAGKSDMTLHGLRQLAEWSIQHSCMEPKLMKEVYNAWTKMWNEFCQKIVDGAFTIKDDAGAMLAEANVEASKAVGGG